MMSDPDRFRKILTSYFALCELLLFCFLILEIVHQTCQMSDTIKYSRTKSYTTRKSIRALPDP